MFSTKYNKRKFEYYLLMGIPLSREELQEIENSLCTKENIARCKYFRENYITIKGFLFAFTVAGFLKFFSYNFMYKE